MKLVKDILLIRAEREEKSAQGAIADAATYRTNAEDADSRAKHHAALAAEFRAAAEAIPDVPSDPAIDVEHFKKMNR